MRLKIHPFQLPLKNTFTISRLSRDVQPSIVVELEQDGQSGLGEATANAYYNMTIESMTAILEQLRPKIEAYTLDTPEKFWQYLYEDLKDTPFVQCALDEAAHDLWAKQQQKPLYAAWNLALTDALPLTNYTIGIADIDKMVAKMEAMPWPIYKIKLGTDHDLEIVRALRQHTKATFRVDANCAWTVEQTIAYAKELKTLGVEFIEQPLP
ncbi:MAG: enolase C-terminal domain-like protein, partial [Bacteroidota bacterium]